MKNFAPSKFFPHTPHPTPHTLLLWLGLSLVFATIYGGLAIAEAFSQDYIIQDDARQHVFWMRRFLDPDLFPNDAIADYFQSVAPPGYATLYRVFAILGVDPVILSKILPLVLGWVTTIFCFGVCLELRTVPAAGFMAATLLNQQIWLNEDLVSATPRAFVYPLFLAFLYFLLRRKPIICGLAIALLGLFYPQYVLVAAGILFLRLWTRTDRDRRLCGIGLGMSAIVILYYASGSGEFGPVISAAEAKTFSEFGGAGNSAFFDDNPWRFFVSSPRSGLLPKHLFRPPLLWVGLALPPLLRFPKRFPAVRQISPQITILGEWLLSAVGLFAIAHLLLFRLHLPNRYTIHSFRMIIALAAGISLWVLFDAVWRWGKHRPRRRLAAIALSGLLGLAIASGTWFWGKFPKTGYVKGTEPALYEFLARQPEDIVIASIAAEADNIPTFSRRSIWVGWEYAIPYHLGYYLPLQERVNVLIRAVYSPDLDGMRALIAGEGIDYILLDRDSFTPDYVFDNRWLRQWYHSHGKDIRSLYRQGIRPAIADSLEACSVLETGRSLVLSADCLLQF